MLSAASTSAASRARSWPTCLAAPPRAPRRSPSSSSRTRSPQQNNRTILEKLREAALAYHLTREWSKEKILNEYLNSIYFGNGAYGVESAARVYFGRVHGLDQAAATDGATTGCGDSTPAIRPELRLGAGAVGGGAAGRDGGQPVGL